MPIRPAAPDDAPRIADLCGQLGYPLHPDSARERLSEFATDTTQQVFVACDENGLIGWIHVVQRLTLAGDAFAEIEGLIVDESHRSHGAGRELLRRAEAWAGERGVHRVRVHSNLIRERAHAFYLREHYALIKRQAVFEKEV